VPSHLKTKTQLSKEGLKPAKDQQPAATFRNIFNDNIYPLYDVSQAVAKRQATPAQLAALVAARVAAEAARTCQGCGMTFSPQQAARRLKEGYCRWCRDHRNVVQWARELLNDPEALIVDTETTGLDLDSEVIEITIITMAGQVLLNTLVRPQGEMGATEIHGLTAADLATAPAWPDIDSQVEALLLGASRVIAYGSEFDSSMIDQTRLRWGLPELPTWYSVGIGEEPPARLVTWDCAMHAYAMWVGDWSSYHNGYRWHALGGGHRALGDCLSTLERIQEIARDAQNPSVG
jgi:DNA polymerase-3 subunit epsilon